MSRHAHIKRAKQLRTHGIWMLPNHGSGSGSYAFKIYKHFRASWVARIRRPTNHPRNLAHAIRGGYHS